MAKECCGGTKLIFTCSGSADVGAIADQAARKLMKDGVAKMVCLAGIGGRVSGMMETAKTADKTLVIDGCPHACARHCMEHAGFKKFKHLQISRLGLEKGKSTLNSRSVGKVVAEGKKLLT